MRRNILYRLQQLDLREASRRLKHDQKGNVLIMVAAALIPLLGLVGSGVDISRAYMAQLRLQQACDAGVLAGRRTMAAGQWSGTPMELGTPNGEAHQMFHFNYPENFYGSNNIDFNAAAISSSNVVGTATAVLPTVFMHMMPFGKMGFDLSVSCTAEMEIANTDVMLVFDVTGSMDSGSGSGTRMDALQQAAKDFFDTITRATRAGDGRLRIGMVPYNSMANVGSILLAKDPSWISDYSVISSRTPRMYYYWSNSSDRDAVRMAPQPSRGDWENLLIDSYPKSSSVCTSTTNRPLPAPTFAGNSASPNMNVAGRPYSRSSSNSTSNSSLTATQITSSGQRHYFYDYRYSWSGNSCWLQRRLNEVVLTKAISSPSVAFRDYMHENRVIDVRPIKNSFTFTRNSSTGAEIYQNTGRLTINSGNNGGNHSNIPWTGCVMERRTEYTSGTTAPSGTLDLDVDIPPSSAESRWMMIFPDYTYSRTQTIGNTTNSLSPNAGTAAFAKFGRTLTGGEGESAWGNCPAAAKKLTTMTESDRSTFESWLDELEPIGGTYHDAGLVWGLRLISPDGMFKDENSAAPNSRPIGRHIIFMTDGEADARASILSHQGYEVVDRRVSGSSTTSNADMKVRHQARFAALCEQADAKNITVWVIAFATTPDKEVRECATAGKLYVAQSRSELIAAFNNIAGQISRLRLAQ